MPSSGPLVVFGLLDLIVPPFIYRRLDRGCSGPTLTTSSKEPPRAKEGCHNLKFERIVQGHPPLQPCLNLVQVRKRPQGGGKKHVIQRGCLVGPWPRWLKGSERDRRCIIRSIFTVWRLALHGGRLRRSISSAPGGVDYGC